MPVMSRPQKMAIKATSRAISFEGLNIVQQRGRRTEENFLPTLTHRQPEG
jgi:hypothetical protein